MFAAVSDPRLAGEYVVGNDGPPNLFAQLDLWFIFPKLATADQDGAARHLQSVAPFLVPIPLHEGAIAETDRSLSVNFGDLIARTPEGAVHKTDATGISGLDANHRWVRAMKRHKLAIGNQQAERS